MGRRSTSERYRGGLSASWWGIQAFIVGFGGVFLAITGNTLWLVLLVPAVWMGFWSAPGSVDT
jgi:hypothetical protein